METVSRSGLLLWDRTALKSVRFGPVPVPRSGPASLVRGHWWYVKRKAIVLSSSICMFIDWSLASLEWTLVLYLYMIPGPQLPEPGFFHRILAVSSCFRALPEASICLTNPSLLMITNAYQPYFEISDLELLITDDYRSHYPASGCGLGFL